MLRTLTDRCEQLDGGDGGIRTLDRALQPYNGLANRRLQPLGHVSVEPICPTQRRAASARFKKRRETIRRIHIEARPLWPRSQDRRARVFCSCPKSDSRERRGASSNLPT